MIPVSSTPSPDVALGHLDRLPTLPPVAIRVLELVADPTSNARDLIQVIRADQSLTAKILSVASSVGAAARPVQTLEQAIPLLGYASIRSIVLATTVFDFFRTHSEPAAEAGFDRSAFWMHSLGVACAARSIARALPSLQIDPEHAYVAGLLHDLGKVALAAIFPKAYDRIAQRAVAERSDIADAERALLGIDHTRAGRRLAERWKLAPELRDAIWLHHLAGDTLPSSVRQPRLVTLVNAADTIAREQRVGFSGNFTFFDHSQRLGAALGLTPAQLDSIATQLVRETTEQARFLGLAEDPPERRYVRAMSEANSELSRINTELAAKNQRLAAAARYFAAIRAFDQQIGPCSDLCEVVEAAAEAGRNALQAPAIAAFALQDGGDRLEAAISSNDGAMRTVQLPVLEQGFAESLVELERSPGSVLTRPPAQLHRALAGLSLPTELSSGWLAPIYQDRRFVGGILAPATTQASSTADVGEDLRGFLDCLGLAFTRANAQQAARRLTEDLADTNRRLQQMQSELLRGRTLSMIAEMASGAGHELNSPLTVISGRAQMLAQEMTSPEQKRSLDVIREKAHDCSRIVTELMDFARPRPARLSEFDLVDLLAELQGETLSKMSWTSDRLVLDLRGADRLRPVGGETPVFRIEADIDQLRTLFRELLTNAAEAVQENSAAVEILCRPASGLDGFEVVVRDRGVGMSAPVQERAFDPFFSFRRAGRRRGLGLARAYRIVEVHRGRIWLESTPGAGTAVHVLLPRSQPKPEPADPTAGPVPPTI